VDCRAIPTTRKAAISRRSQWHYYRRLYIPNGNPAPGPKFDYKLKWFERFILHAARLIEGGGPAVLAGDFNVMPTELDVYKPERWVDDALFRPEVRAAFHRLIEQGWCDTPAHHPSGAR
jgi:exodeoxyribonuclease-3